MLINVFKSSYFFPCPFAIMINSRLEAQRQPIYYYWLNGVQSPKKIHKKTNIPYRTVLDNLKKLRDTGTIEHKKGNGRLSKVTQNIARTVRQQVRRNSAISTRKLAFVVQKTQNISISHVACCQQMYGKNWRLQQDNDPKHTSRVAKDFIVENKIRTIDWPSNSPGLNPIENMWYIVKNNVEKRMPRNIDELKHFMTEEWMRFWKQPSHLISSMKKRCELVLEKNGDKISH